MLASEKCELPVELWLKLAAEMKTMSDRTPELMLWGGEPLLYPQFDYLADTLVLYRVFFLKNNKFPF